MKKVDYYKAAVRAQAEKRARVYALVAQDHVQATRTVQGME